MTVALSMNKQANGYIFSPIFHRTFLDYHLPITDAMLPFQ